MLSNYRRHQKDAVDRQVIIEKVQKKLKEDTKSLIGNKGYRKYLTVGKDQISINFCSFLALVFKKSWIVVSIRPVMFFIYFKIFLRIFILLP